ncbi:MAG TPA: hypothetical protein VK171_07090 [Fimbriimonas sp.]|nr:hypothetical protein [Fimbriimonas sp.]
MIRGRDVCRCIKTIPQAVLEGYRLKGKLREDRKSDAKSKREQRDARQKKGEDEAIRISPDVLAEAQRLINQMETEKKRREAKEKKWRR